MLDEPFSNLDSPLRASLREQLIELHRKFATTLIHVTHDQAEAMLMGERIAILKAGRLLQCAPPRTIYDHPADRFVATFVGTPSMNIIPCQIERQDDAIKVIPLAADHAFAWTSSAEKLPDGWQGTTRLFDLGLRPEAITVGAIDSATDETPARAKLVARIRRLEFNGPEVLATLMLGPHRLTARLPARQPVADNQSVSLFLDLDHARWFDQSTGMAIAPA